MWLVMWLGLEEDWLGGERMGALCLSSSRSDGGSFRIFGFFSGKAEADLAAFVAVTVEHARVAVDDRGRSGFRGEQGN